MTFNNIIKELVKKNNVDKLKCFCADKLNLRKYCIKKIGWNLCPKIEYIFPDNNLDFPYHVLNSKRRFIIKCNHDWKSSTLLDFNKDVNIDRIKSIFTSKLKRNYALRHGEYQYFNIKRKAYIEECIENIDEVRFYCFGGKCYFLEVFVVVDVLNPELDYINMYDRDYNPFEFRKARSDYSKYCIDINFYNELLQYAEKLAFNFDFVRVDFYIDKQNKSFYLSELTFSPFAGKIKFASKEADEKFVQLYNNIKKD